MSTNGLAGRLAELSAALRAHHEWHLAQTDVDPVISMAPADAYVESPLFDQTHAALALHATSQPLPQEGGRVPDGWRLVPVDDLSRPFPQSVLPFAMIEAGIETYEHARADLGPDYVAGVTPDWDVGMIVVAVYRAMLAAAPQPPTPSTGSAERGA